MRLFHQTVVVVCALLPRWVLAANHTDTCQRDDDCLNEGTCSSASGASVRQCQCQEGYSGLRCEKFCPLQCANEGRCFAKKGDASSNSVTQTNHNAMFADASPELAKTGRNSGHADVYFNNYACHCKGLFTGYLCDIPYTNCGDMTRCFYGGECQPDNEIEPCKCAEGYSGRYCELFGAWDDDGDSQAGLVEFPRVDELPDQEPQSSAKKSWPIILGALGIGSVIGLALFIWTQKKQRRRMNSTWLVTSHTSASSSTADTFEESSRTFVNVI